MAPIYHDHREPKDACTPQCGNYSGPPNWWRIRHALPLKVLDAERLPDEWHF